MTLTDALHHVTTYTYDNMDRVSTRTDPLQRQETYTYDLGGLLASFTDRKGQVRSYTFGGIKRLTSVSFAVPSGSGGTTIQSSISYSYDAGNRMLQAADSASGTVTHTFDLLDRLTNETTPQGSIGYTYDNAGRRSTMQVAGQSQVTYSWDNANRLTGIAQGANSVGFTYDNASRRTSLTLPNGIVASYSYDQASHLTGISYGLGGNPVGDLSYRYDSLGRRTSMGGSLAATNLPQPLSTTTYDAANQLTGWNGVSINYDANGNMVSDSVHTYSWDARNQLSAIDSGGAAAFTYDVFGRRSSKTIAGVSATGFLYDGANPAQELNGSSPSANLLTGGLDEYFYEDRFHRSLQLPNRRLRQRAGPHGCNWDDPDAIQYDPFGSTTASGASTTNSFGYTGRELDTAGLYFYRARYYNPQLGRFISEDPLGLFAGVNSYVYTGDNPVSFIDPFGQDKHASNNPTICGGTFTFAGRELDLGEGGAFTGAITEHDSVNGNSVASLNEAWVGGEGPVVGVGSIGPLGDPGSSGIFF